MVLRNYIGKRVRLRCPSKTAGGREFTAAETLTVVGFSWSFGGSLELMADDGHRKIAGVLPTEVRVCRGARQGAKARRKGG